MSQNEDRITIRPLRLGTVDRGAAEIAGLEILYELLEQSPHLLCQWRLTTHGEAQQILCYSGDGCMMRLLFEFYLSTDIDNIKQPHQAAQPQKAGSRVCAAGIRKGKVLRTVQGSQGRTVQAENRKAECCVLFPGGRTGAAGEIKECAYDQSENRPGVSVPDSPSDR